MKLKKINAIKSNIGKVMEMSFLPFLSFPALFYFLIFLLGLHCLHCCRIFDGTHVRSGNNRHPQQPFDFHSNSKIVVSGRKKDGAAERKW